MRKENIETFARKFRIWFFSLLTPAFISTLVSAVFIWAHLARIGQTGLFFESLSFSSLSGYLMVFACLSVLAFCIVFFMPSLLAGVFISNDKEDDESREELMENNIRIVFLISLLSVLVLLGYHFVTTFISKSISQNFYVQLVTIFALSILLSVIFNIRITQKRIERNERLKCFHTIIFMHIIQPAMFTLCACIYLVPLTLFLKTLEFPNGTSDLKQELAVATLACCLILFSLIPGAVFLRLRARSSLLRQVTMTGSIMLGIMTVLSLFVHMIPAFILTMFLKFSGIMDMQPHRYAVATSPYPAEYFSDAAWQGTKSADGKFYLLKAVKLYSLGEIRLLCPLNIIAVYKESLSYQLLDQQYDAFLREKLQDAVTHCRRVKGYELLTLEKLTVPESV